MIGWKTDELIQKDLSVSMLKRYSCTMQHDQSDCAAAVVSTVLLSYKKELSIMKIREIIGTDMYGRLWVVLSLVLKS